MLNWTFDEQNRYFMDIFTICKEGVLIRLYKGLLVFDDRNADKSITKIMGICTNYVGC